MNTYSKAGIVFGIMAAVVWGYWTWQYMEFREIVNNLFYRKTATCAPNNIFLDDSTKLALCKAEQDQRQIEELKEILKGLL